MMTALEKRYQVAIDKIGHARLLNLPEQIKELLKKYKRLENQNGIARRDSQKYLVETAAWRSAGTAPPAPMRQGIKRKDG